MGIERDRVILDGTVIESCMGKFRVQVSENHIVLCTLSGKIRQNSVKIIEGDKVSVEVSQYDTSQGRITYRTR